MNLKAEVIMPMVCNLCPCYMTAAVNLSREDHDTLKNTLFVTELEYSGLIQTSCPLLLGTAMTVVLYEYMQRFMLEVVPENHRFRSWCFQVGLGKSLT